MNSHPVMVSTKPNIVFDEQQARLQCSGDWTVLTLDSLWQEFKLTALPKDQKIVVSGKAIDSFDSAGAVTLIKCIKELKDKNNQIEWQDFSENHRELLQLVDSKEQVLEYQLPSPSSENILYSIGKETENKVKQIDGLIILIGDLSTKILEAFGSWRRFQVPSIISNIYSVGIQALPIIALLSFLIGVVLAYQMGLQLQTYGANIFIAYLSGMAIFREFGPLITAIIVAGRTSSSFTAQIGSMKLNEEIDALLTMGLSPTELLVMPKVLALLFIFPLLIFWSDCFSILGSMIMSNSMLQITFQDFLHRLRDSVGLSQFRLGLYKAPAFAIIIALVGCYQGLRVDTKVDTIGRQTTKSVVQALFLIIIADAVYSVIFSWLKL